MPNKDINNIDDFKGLLDQTAQRWKSVEFSRMKGNPAAVFATTWDANTAKGAIKTLSGPAKTTGWATIGAALLPALSLSPLAVIPMAAMAGIGIYKVRKATLSKKDDQLIESEFPEFQKELREILKCSQELSKSLNQELADKGVNDQIRKDKLVEIQKSLEEFLVENLEMTEQSLRTGRVDSKNPRLDLDTTALEEAAKALRTVKKEIGTRPLTSDKGSSKDLGREFGRDIPSIEPNRQNEMKPRTDPGRGLGD